MVFPTHVGVFLTTAFFSPMRASLPHARGGVSIAELARETGIRSSPRTWGCFLLIWRASVYKSSLPHARGGVSNYTYTYALINRSSPRTWGCFSGTRHSFTLDMVFPTHVGVFLNKS